MNRRLGLLATVLVVAVATHVVAILATPRILTTIAAGRIAERGALGNRWIYPPRATETSRQIVRPSPDLAYAACVFDLRHGPVRVTVSPGAAYTSLSLYDPNTNVTVIHAGQPVDLVIARLGQTVPQGPWRVHRTSERWGVALQRRLAPTEAAFEQADRLRRQDRCEPLA